MGCMGSLACTGDGPLPFIVAGVVLVAAGIKLKKGTRKDEK